MAEEIDTSRETDKTDNYERLTDAVSELVDIMCRGDLERLEVSQGDLHILLCAKTSATHSDNHSGDSLPADSVQQSAPASTPDNPAPVWHQITSPMVGTYYEAPSPGDPPFVRPGDHVEVGQTVAIIEAMKIMNEIVADRSGVIDAVLVENGETVEFGHPLFRMRPS